MNEIAQETFGPLENYVMQASDIASKAAELVGGERNKQHGAKLDNFNKIANMWNAWLKTRRNPEEALNAHDVGIMMVLLKVARTECGVLNMDDYTDMAGYAACAGEVAQQ